jgi:hypothetical protein
MKRMQGFFAIVLLIILLVGCGVASNAKPISREDEPGITGYVMKKENGRILVISTEKMDFSSTGGVDEFYDAIWFSKAPEEIEVGDKVKVWYDIVLESYPGQSEAIDLEVVEAIKPEGAKLTDSEALQAALFSQSFDDDTLLVVKEIEYDAEADSWNVKLKDLWNDKIYDVEIEDK